MSRTSSRTRSAIAILSATAMAVLSSSLPASGHGDEGHMAAAQEAHEAFVAAPGDPALTSDNVKFLSNFPETLGISGTFSTSTKHFYVSSLDTISVFDISNPKNPVLTGTTDNFVFENEAMTYGEQRVNGELRQFVLVGVDLNQASTDDPQHVNAGDGNELVLVDVTDPAKPRIRSRVADTTSSTHTVACVQATKCNFAYSAGSSGVYSIFDLRHWNNPKEVDGNPDMDGVQGFTSPALRANPVFTRGAGHKWNFVGKGTAIHTGSGGTAFFDVRRPLRPRLLTTTNDQALKGPWNDFIHHNSWQPHRPRFEPGRRASLANGNVLLVTEEDYEQTDCSKAGSFQTWRIGNFNSVNSVTPLDRVELTDLGGPTEGIFPQGAFCSAHWFDYHQTGIVAVAYYNGGVRLIDARDPKDLKSYGFAYGGGETWDAYWVPRYNAKTHSTKRRTNILYSVDLVRGLDVYSVDLPATSVIGPN